MVSDTLCDLGKGSSLFCLVKSANLNRLGRAILFQDAFLPAGEEVLGLWQLETLGGGLFLASSDPMAMATLLPEAHGHVTLECVPSFLLEWTEGPLCSSITPR